MLKVIWVMFLSIICELLVLVCRMMFLNLLGELKWFLVDMVVVK